MSIKNSTSRLLNTIRLKKINVSENVSDILVNKELTETMQDNSSFSILPNDKLPFIIPKTRNPNLINSSSGLYLTVLDNDINIRHILPRPIEIPKREYLQKSVKKQNNNPKGISQLRNCHMRLPPPPLGKSLGHGIVPS